MLRARKPHRHSSHATGAFHNGCRRRRPHTVIRGDWWWRAAAFHGVRRWRDASLKRSMSTWWSTQTLRITARIASLPTESRRTELRRRHRRLGGNQAVGAYVDMFVWRVGHGQHASGSNSRAHIGRTAHDVEACVYGSSSTQKLSRRPL